ncbi:MAG: hypothetical protein ACREV4_03785 [Gammaproteobacteria bacterium]
MGGLKPAHPIQPLPRGKIEHGLPVRPGLRQTIDKSYLISAETEATLLAAL